MTRNTSRDGKKLKSMITELNDLRGVRREFEKLLKTLHSLGLASKAVLHRAHKSTPAALNRGAPRYRSTNKVLFSQYKQLSKKIPTKWSTRENICASAGMDPQMVVVPFMWLVKGGKDENKKPLKPLLKSNGRRGLGCVYKKI